MTGDPELQSLQLGFSNAATLQEKTGIPAILFGLLQFAVLLAIYRAILRKERPRHPEGGRGRLNARLRRHRRGDAFMGLFGKRKRREESRGPGRGGHARHR